MSNDVPGVDVAVIGGGPGGSTAATMLARKGLRVLLLEREHFPREHVGESLLPATVPILEEIGVREAVEAAGFLKKYGATMVWGSDREPWSWYFRETSAQYPHSYQVSRPEFDQLLLANSRAHGVDVREGHRVLEVLFEDGTATGVRFAASDGIESTVRARFIVDASGRAGLIGHARGLRRWDGFFRNFALYGYFRDAERLPEPDASNIFIESHAEGWCWTIPLHTGVSSVGVVLDAETAQRYLEQCSTGELFRSQLALAPRTSALLDEAALVEGPFAVRDWSYTSDAVVGDGYILVGDAACFVDPLFSSGVHLAMSSAVLAAAYVTSALNDSTLREAAQPVYTRLYRRQYDHFHALARLFYSSNRTAQSYFWEARRIAGDETEFSPRHAFINAVAGQPPQGYERAVLDRGEAPAAFTAGVRAVEQERGLRQARLETAGEAFADAVPTLQAGVTVEREPVLAEGEFAWGHVVRSDAHPEGTPCSPFVAALLTRIDGSTTTRELVDALHEVIDAPQNELARMAGSTIGILYVDGSIASLEGI